MTAFRWEPGRGAACSLSAYRMRPLCVWNAACTHRQPPYGNPDSPGLPLLSGFCPNACIALSLDILSGPTDRKTISQAGLYFPGSSQVEGSCFWYIHIKTANDMATATKSSKIPGSTPINKVRSSNCRSYLPRGKNLKMHPSFTK